VDFLTSLSVRNGTPGTSVSYHIRNIFLESAASRWIISWRFRCVYKLPKATISFVIYVCPSVCMEKLCSF